jgi:hypothetical protein
MYLMRLANDEIELNDRNAINEYVSFLDIHITSLDILVDFVKTLKCKLKTDNLESFFEPLKPFIKRFKPKQSTILSTSHAFCECCELYIPSHLSMWVHHNVELFETEIVFYFRLFQHFGSLIKADVPSYPVEEFLVGEDTPISGQTERERMRILSSVVKHYEYICNIILE